MSQRPTSPSTNSSTFRWPRRLLIIFALCVLGLAISTAASKTITHDELWHLPVGLRNLREGRFDIDRINSPLSRMWAAIPLYLTGIETDKTVMGADAGLSFVRLHPQNFESLYFQGRVFHLFWWVACGGLLYFWAKRWMNEAAAILMAVLYLTCPTILAHSSVITPDAPLMCAMVATLYALWNWQVKPTWGRAGLWGAALGIALAVKFTALLIYPCVFISVVLVIIRNRRIPKVVAQVIGQTIVACFLSTVVLSACYGFQGVYKTFGDYPFQSQTLKILQSVSILKPLPVPVPAEFALGLDQQRAIMEFPHPVFLDGRWSLQGFRHYYLMAMLWKIPVPHLILIVTGVIGWARMSKTREDLLKLVFLLTPIILTLLIVSREGMQLGLRYILQLLPLLYLLAIGNIYWLSKIPKKLKPVIISTVILAAMLSLRHHPHHLTYFNELAGGPIHGRYHLIDSNLDWGQDLNLTAAYLKKQNIQNVKLAYFGTVPPELYGIQFEVPPAGVPVPGMYAVSVNYVMGRPHVIFQPDGSKRSVNFDEFGYLRAFRPKVTLGNSVDIYEITPADLGQ